MKRYSKGCAKFTFLGISESTQSSPAEFQLAKFDSQSSTNEPDGEESCEVGFPKWPLQSSDPKEQFLAILKNKTKKIRQHYMEFSQRFKRSFLSREQSGEVEFGDLREVAQDAFDFDDECIESLQSKGLLSKILSRQSYMNFDMLISIVAECGSAEDKTAAEKYTEAYRQYAKERTFESDSDLLGKDSLPGHDTIMFVLDKGQSFRLIDAYDFKVSLSEILGVKLHKIFLHQVEIGSIKISIQIHSKYRKFLHIIPLFQSHLLSLKEWHTLSYHLQNRVVYLHNWNIISSIDLGEDYIVNTARAQIVQAKHGETECLAIKYTERFSDKSSADPGYMDYLDAFLSGKYKYLPDVKGVCYNQSSEDSQHCYPTLIVDKMMSLQKVASTQEMSQINQVSLLHDILSSVASFEHDQKYEVSVFPDSVFVQESSDQICDITARFCPLYGHSFLSKELDLSIDFYSTPLPLERLQWMRDVVKYIHFQGKPTAKSEELPDSHILKKMFDQKWISIEDRFRPMDFRTLRDELQHILGKLSV